MDDRAKTRRWRVARWSLIAVLLLLPLVAMQFTSEVDWDAADFALAALLLIGAGALYESRRVTPLAAGIGI